MNLLVRYNGPVLQSDYNNTASAVVERDANGDVAHSGAHIAVAGTSLPSAAPTSAAFLSLIGALLLGADTQTGNVTLSTASKCLQKLNAASAAFTVTLPLASTSGNLTYTFIKSDSSAHVPTIQGTGSDSITTNAGVTANTYTGLTAQGNAIKLWCDGTQWWQIP